MSMVRTMGAVLGAGAILFGQAALAAANDYRFEVAQAQPPGMVNMPGKVTPVPPGKDGLYHFAAQTGMAGKWALHLAAKLRGETETVRGTVEFDGQ